MLNKKQEQTKEIPLGVKIISVLHYIVACVYALFGISSIIFSTRIATGIVIANDLDVLMIKLLSTWIIILSVVLMIGMAVLEFFIARGLWNCRRWTRVMIIIFAVINIAFIILILLLLQAKILDFIGGLALILINIAIIFYLIFSNKVNEFFRKD